MDSVQVMFEYKAFSKHTHEQQQQKKTQKRAQNTKNKHARTDDKRKCIGEVGNKKKKKGGSGRV